MLSVSFLTFHSVFFFLSCLLLLEFRLTFVLLCFLDLSSDHLLCYIVIRRIACQAEEGNRITRGTGRAERFVTVGEEKFKRSAW